MRTLLGAGILFVLAGGVAIAEEKIDAKKLVGKWERPGDKEKKQPKAVVEYTADGKLMAVIGEDFKIEGTYKVEGNKITQMVKVKDKDITRTITVTKLTDEVLEAENDKGEKNTYKRVKAEKKKD